MIIDGPDSWAKELVDEKIVEKFYGIDFTDESTIFDRCLAKIKEAEKVGPYILDPAAPHPSARTVPLALERHLLWASTCHLGLCALLKCSRILVCCVHSAAGVAGQHAAVVHLIWAMRCLSMGQLCRRWGRLMACAASGKLRSPWLPAWQSASAYWRTRQKQWRLHGRSRCADACVPESRPMRY